MAKPKRWAKPKAWATAIRAARAAAAVPLVDIAAAHKMSEPDMRRCLRGLPPRGRCAAVVAGVAAAQRPGPDDQTAAGHWACPPPAVRAVTADAAAVVTATARGSTSWGLKTRSVGSMPHVRLPRHTAVQFAADPAGHVRVQAANGDCPPGVLIRLSDDNDAQVQAWCAHNWGLPQSALRHLSVHPSAGIRAGVANNPATPAYLVAVLAADPEPGVRSGAADNPACPPEALRDLIEDPEIGIRQRVAERSDSAAALGGAAVTEVWESLASDNHYTRKQAAKHGDLAADTVARLAADPTWIVRFEIARRNDLDPVIVEQLASDHDWRVRRATAEREDLAADTVARSRCRRPHESTGQDRRSERPACGSRPATRHRPRPPSPSRNSSPPRSRPRIYGIGSCRTRTLKSAPQRDEPRGPPTRNAPRHRFLAGPKIHRSGHDAEVSQLSKTR